VSRWAVARAICDAGRQLAERGLIAGAEGNLSARCDDGVLITPAGSAKGRLAPADLVLVDGSGRARGGLKPSTELGMHLAVYAQRADVGAVVHAHPPAATGFAAAGLPLDDDVLPELLVEFGTVPLVSFGMPGSPELGAAIRPFAAEHDALLLANHGAVTFGPTVEEAERRMESLEQGARILLIARMLGGARRLPQIHVETLRAVRRRE
jgi:L-fuculose-phosphate aldolase